MTLNGLNGHYALNFHYYDLARFEGIFYLFSAESVYIGVSLVTSGGVGSGVADCDPQNISSPRKERGSFVDATSSGS